MANYLYCKLVCMFFAIIFRWLLSLSSCSSFFSIIDQLRWLKKWWLVVHEERTKVWRTLFLEILLSARSGSLVNTGQFGSAVGMLHRNPLTHSNLPMVLIFMGVAPLTLGKIFEVDQHGYLLPVSTTLGKYLTSLRRTTIRFPVMAASPILNHASLRFMRNLLSTLLHFYNAARVVNK